MPTVVNNFNITNINIININTRPYHRSVYTYQMRSGYQSPAIAPYQGYRYHKPYHPVYCYR
jgi:hypothetical protein